MTSFAVVVQPTAEAEIEEAYEYLVSAASHETAIRWFSEIESAITTLEQMPQRCVLAPENQHFEEEIRQLLIAPYRILFTIREKSVHVLHVRHMARRWLGEAEER